MSFLILVWIALYTLSLIISLSANNETQIVKFFNRFSSQSIPGKITKIQLNKSNISRVYKISKNDTIPNFGEVGVIKPEPQKTVNYSEQETLGLSKRSEGETSVQYLQSWSDVNKALGEEEIKTFLSSLPLDVLRNVTSLAKKNPKEGEQRLIQLFMNSKFAEIIHSRNALMENKNNVKQIQPTTYTSEEVDNEKPTINLIENEESSAVNSLHSSDRNSLSSDLHQEFEAPIYQENLPEPSIYPNEGLHNHKFYLLDSGISSVPEQKPSYLETSNTNEEIKKQKVPRKISSLTNSGYFLPELSNSGINYNQIDFEYSPVDNPSTELDNKLYNPMNTFKPNVDQFLNPPAPIEINKQQDQGLYNPIYQGDYAFSDTPTAQDIDFGQQRQESHLEVDRVETSSATVQDHYGQDSRPSQEFVPTINDIPNTNYHYHHSTVENELPIKSHSISTEDNENDNNIHEYYEQGPIVISGDYNNQNNELKPYTDYDQYNKYNIQTQHPTYQSPPQNQQLKKEPPKYTSPAEQSPANVGWRSPQKNSDWGPSEIWNSLKSYFKKDEKSKAQKVFEISIAILSFLAFGGYLVMLIYQVFAVTTRVPLFPLFSPTRPQNPTIFGLLFGRSIASDGSYRFMPNELFGDQYIEDLEEIVKIAMERVKLDWSSAKESLNLKGDLGH